MSALIPPRPTTAVSRHTRAATSPLTNYRRTSSAVTRGGINEEDSSLLHKAVKDRRLHQFRLLMSLGVDVDKKDPYGRTAMMVAATMDPEEFGLKLMRMCIKHNADVNEQDRNGRSVLGYACMCGRERMASSLLQNSSHELIKNLPDINGDIPLNLAAANGHAVIVRGLIKSLLKDGLPVDVRNKQGCTALILAAKHGHYNCAQVLLEDGKASANIRDNVFFMSPLEWAKYSQSHFERELKLLRVISVSKSTQSEMLNVHTPAWCDNKQALHALPALTLVASHERPNFQKKKQLLAQFRTRQVHLSALIQVIQPKIPEKVSYSRKTSLRNSYVDQMTELSSLKPEEESPSRSQFAKHSMSRTFPPTANAKSPRNTSSEYLGSLFKIYEGFVGSRPSQQVNQQETAITSTENAMDEPEEEQPDVETAAVIQQSTSGRIGRRGSRAGLGKKHSAGSLQTSHAQNLAIPQVLRKSKSMPTN